LAVLKLLQIAQNHGLAQLRRKMTQSRLHLRAQLCQQRLLVRPSSRRLLVLHYGHRIIQRIRGPIALGPSVMVAQQVARHAGHPGCKSAVDRAVATKGPVHPKEHILRQVLGFRSVAGKPVANVEYATRMATHKLLPGRAVSLEALLDQLGILLQRKSASHPQKLPESTRVAASDHTSAAATVISSGASRAAL